MKKLIAAFLAVAAVLAPSTLQADIAEPRFALDYLWAKNGTPAVWMDDPAVLPWEVRMTEAEDWQTSSIWFGGRQHVETFTASFEYQVLAGSGSPAEGVCFVLQNDPRGVSAIGDTGADRGYLVSVAGARIFWRSGSCRRWLSDEFGVARMGYAAEVGVEGWFWPGARRGSLQASGWD